MIYFVALTPSQCLYRLSSMTDPVIKKAKKLFEKSGKSLEEVGLAMGYPPGTARRAAWQLLNKIENPSVGALRKFAHAIGVEIKELF
jgi:transcriptional regulator with XRE-family HTH domain